MRACGVLCGEVMSDGRNAASRNHDSHSKSKMKGKQSKKPTTSVERMRSSKRTNIKRHRNKTHVLPKEINAGKYRELGMKYGKSIDDFL